MEYDEFKFKTDQDHELINQLNISLCKEKSHFRREQITKEIKNVRDRMVKRRKAFLKRAQGGLDLL